MTQQATLGFLMGFQKKPDEAAIYAAMSRPMLLDYPVRVLSFHQLAAKKQRLALLSESRAPRRVWRAKVTPIKCLELEDALDRVWFEHCWGPRSDVDSQALSRRVDLHGARLQVVSCPSRILPKRISVEGIVVRETKHVIHLSSAKHQRVFVIPKCRTVFSCRGVCFRRFPR